MDETNSETIGRAAEPMCPPSVSDALWEAIPVARRQEFLEAAAMGLRRAVHPETTISDMLAAIGIRPNAAAPRPAAPTGMPAKLGMPSRFVPPDDGD
jgi:hypothetical protein